MQISWLSMFYIIKEDFGIEAYTDYHRPEIKRYLNSVPRQKNTKTLNL